MSLSLFTFSSSSPWVPTLVLLLSLPLLFILAPRILPLRPVPISLPDELDDISLFHRAAADSPPHQPLSSAKSRLGSTNPKPKIAFLFLTNSDLHFAPLWEQFFSNGSQSTNRYNIYIHADPTVKINPPGGVFTDRFIPAKRTRRSSATLIAAARRLLATALLDDSRNAFFALSSRNTVSHSIPSISSTTLCFTDRSPNWLNWVRYSTVASLKFRRKNGIFCLDTMREVKMRCFRRCPLSNSDLGRKEHYFPTLLSMEDPGGCTHYTLTRVNWTDCTDGHPHTYRPPELSPELIYKLRQSNFTHPYLFARKFSPDCLTPLLNISDSVIFRD
ncbi:core-2/I-branching beta-1,6-N-acetylglucosaminyltransferase family protein [Actinidia rufa]|uniref:Core-2/I-branching beta-1,6-N-acetylglucosaminyltransferase family protein n=1 Tax=Actinidia rufa TaxID=165716 RepID=A0A7J0HAZ3_9ERIC|nr:core-2/I-branching beta-1,6-N-acetylglucosaminyltransferase family protein [Actinidia rufa]